MSSVVDSYYFIGSRSDLKRERENSHHNNLCLDNLIYFYEKVMTGRSTDVVTLIT
jgi:hypothetical protein